VLSRVGQRRRRGGDRTPKRSFGPSRIVVGRSIDRPSLRLQLIALTTYLETAYANTTYRLYNNRVNNIRRCIFAASRRHGISAAAFFVVVDLSIREVALLTCRIHTLGNVEGKSRYNTGCGGGGTNKSNRMDKSKHDEIWLSENLQMFLIL